MAIFSSTLRDRGDWAVEEVPHDSLMLSVSLFSLDSRIYMVGDDGQGDPGEWD